jgi:hypothetical protein
MVLAHILHTRLRPAHQDEKSSPFPRSGFQVLFGQVVPAFSGPTVDHGNPVGLGIRAYAAAESPGQAHQVVVVEGLIGTR